MPIPPPFASAATYYVSTTGTAAGDGTIAQPWDLATALNNTSTVRENQTIIVQAGTYTGDFTCRLAGVTYYGYQPVTIRARGVVQIDGSLWVRGDGCVFDGFEVYSSAWTTRTSAQTGSTPTDITVKEAFTVNGTQTIIRNCVIHDCRQGVLCSADGLIVRDCLFYNNGWTAPDRGHGHHIYTTNTTTPSTIERCVFVGDYDDWGLHAYSAGTQTVSNITAQDNVSIEKIMLFFTGGVMDNDTIDGNEFYRALLDVGQASQDHYGITITGNYLGLPGVAQPPIGLRTKRLKDCTVRRNTVIADAQLLNYTTPNTDPPLSIDWDANTYYHTGAAASAVDDNGTPRTFAAWQAARGLDASSTYTQALPTTNRIRTIARADGKSIVVIYNWENLASVAAPVAGTYQNVLNPAESVTLAAGAALTMSGWSVATPIGDTAPVMTTTFPQFGCFLVTL